MKPPLVGFFLQLLTHSAEQLAMRHGYAAQSTGVLCGQMLKGVCALTGQHRRFGGDEVHNKSLRSINSALGMLGRHKEWPVLLTTRSVWD